MGVAALKPTIGVIPGVKPPGVCASNQMRQYLYFCTSECFSIGTLVLVNPSFEGLECLCKGVPHPSTTEPSSICTFVLVK